ncbi:MAG: hypothetical protein AB1772_10960 [Candidatus Zixiibacteriota bacterium]
MTPQKHSAGRSRRQALSFENSRWFVPAAFLVLFLAIVFLFSDFIFSDQMLYGSDILQASLMFRIYQATYMAAHGGAIPQWMPHQFGGMPFVEAFHSDIFYPPSLLLKYLRVWLDSKIEPIDIARDLGWLMILHIYLSGLFMYRAARQFKLARVPSLFAGASYMFAGYLVSMVAPGHDGKIYVASLFPALMFFLDRGFEKDRFLSQLKYFSLTGLTVGLILLTPHPQMSYFSLWALSFLAAFRLIIVLVQKKSVLPAVRPGLLVVYAVAVGLLLSAIQMYPGISYTQEYSPRADTKRGWEWATSWSMHEEEAASLVIPEFSGTSTDKAKTFYWGKNFFKDNSEWLGTVSLFLAIIGLFFYRHRKEAWFFGILGLFALLYALGGTTPFFWIMFTLVPKVESMRAPAMIMFLGSFAVSLLAGMGLQAVSDLRSEARKSRDNRFNYVLLGFPALLLFLALGFTAAGRSLIGLWCSLFYSEASSEAVQQGVTKLDVAYMNLSATQSGAWIALLLVAMAAMFVWLYRHGKTGAGILIALVALAVIDGMRFNSRFIDVVEDARFSSQYGENPLTRFLSGQEGKFRVINLTAPKDASLPVHGIDVTVGYHGNQLRWYDDLLGGPNLTHIQRFNPRLVNLTGTRYLINTTSGTFPPNHFGPLPLVHVESYGSAKLLRNDNALPRVFLANELKVISDRDAMIAEVLSGASDLRRVALLEEAPPLEIAPEEGAADSVWIVDYQPETVVIGVSTSHDAMLVLTDTWFPSWQVTVDGQPANCLRAYGAFRAVAIPAGCREIRFEYHSARYALGHTVSVVSWLSLLGVIGITWYFGRRRHETQESLERETE